MSPILDEREKYILNLERKLDLAISIMRTARPYVEKHYDASATGFGKHAMKLMNDMHDFIEAIIRMRNDR